MIFFTWSTSEQEVTVDYQTIARSYTTQLSQLGHGSICSIFVNISAANPLAIGNMWLLSDLLLSHTTREIFFIRSEIEKMGLY